MSVSCGFGKHSHAPCKMSHFKDLYGSRFLWESISPQVGWVASAYLKNEGVPLIPEHIGIGCNAILGLIGALWCGLER